MDRFRVTDVVLTYVHLNLNFLFYENILDFFISAVTFSVHGILHEFFSK